MIGCSKDEPKPNANYTGTLVLEYSRSFPEFTASVAIDIDIFKSGAVIFSDPDQVPYNATDSLIFGNSSVKLNVTGTMTVSSLEGRWKVKNDTEYLSVNAYALVEGTQKAWEWDEIAGWQLIGTEPFSVEDPVEGPLEFKISEALQANGSVLGTYETSQYGTLIYQWTLKLNPE